MIRKYEEDGLVTDRYVPERDNEEAQELEALVAQGEGFRLSFRRSTFHRRAENFRDWAIFTGRIDGKLVGLSACALKEMSFRGEPALARFSFDLRVHPDHRNQKIGRRLAGEMFEWRKEEPQLGYSWIVDDNRASQAVSRFWFATLQEGYRYLIYPTYRNLDPMVQPRQTTMADLHQRFVEHAGPFDLYCDPNRGNTGGWVTSWVVERDGQVAGCSVWNNREILGEVVEDLPGGLKAAGALFRAWPFRLARLPHIPKMGEQLQSWYLFDCFATDPLLARALFRFVSRTARDQGIDYCYLIHDSRDTWVDAVRGDLPEAFAPVLRYNLWAGWPRPDPFPELGRIYVDIRDL